MSENLNDPPPAQPKTSGFLDHLKIGLVFGFGPFLVGGVFIKSGPTGTLIMAAVSLALWLWYVLSTARKEAPGKLSKIAGATLGTWLFVLMTLVGAGRDVVTQYHATAVTAEFARQDFAAFDADHTGAVSVGRLQAVVKLQADLKSSLSHIDRARTLIESSAANEAAKGLTTFQMDLLSQTLKAQLLPEDRVARAEVVAKYACSAGTGARHGEDCTVTPNDLLKFREKTEQQYWLWFKVLRLFNAV